MRAVLPVMYTRSFTNFSSGKRSGTYLGQTQDQVRQVYFIGKTKYPW